MLNPIAPIAFVVASQLTGLGTTPTFESVSISDALKQPPKGSNAMTVMTLGPKTFNSDDWGLIQEFLSLHPDIMSVLPDVRRQVNEAFGAFCVIDLEVQHDPTENYESLIARVQFSGEIEDGLDRLENLWSLWRAFAGTRFSGLLVMDVEVA